jgi:Zn-dependent alcohol dehydrogenase
MSSSHKITAFANSETHGKFKVETRDVGKLDEFDLLVDIQAAGVCHTVKKKCCGDPLTCQIVDLSHYLFF